MMTTYTECAMKQEFLNSWNCTIPGIPMVVMVTSRACSLRNPTQQDFINAHPTHIYMSHTIQILKNPPEYTMRYSVQPGRNTKNEMHAHLLGNA